MDEKPKKIQISGQAEEFLSKLPPGERENLMREIVGKIQDGSFFEESRPVDLEKLKREEPDVYEEVMRGYKEAQETLDEDKDQKT